MDLASTHFIFLHTLHICHSSLFLPLSHFFLLASLSDCSSPVSSFTFIYLFSSWRKKCALRTHQPLSLKIMVTGSLCVSLESPLLRFLARLLFLRNNISFTLYFVFLFSLARLPTVIPFLSLPFTLPRLFLPFLLSLLYSIFCTRANPRPSEERFGDSRIRGCDSRG